MPPDHRHLEAVRHHARRMYRNAKLNELLVKARPYSPQLSAISTGFGAYLLVQDAARLANDHTPILFYVLALGVGLLGGFVGWWLDWHMVRAPAQHALGAVLAFVCVNVLLLVSVVLLGWFPDSAVATTAAAGTFATALGLKLLTLAIIPMLKAVPTGVGAGVGGYISKRLLERRKQRAPKP